MIEIIKTITYIIFFQVSIVVIVVYDTYGREFGDNWIIAILVVLFVADIWKSCFIHLIDSIEKL